MTETEVFEIGSAVGVRLELDDEHAYWREKTRLLIGMDRDDPRKIAFEIRSPGGLPHWWHRFWHRVLLGWRWERIE